MASSFAASRIMQSFVSAFAEKSNIAARVAPMVPAAGAQSYRVGGAAMGGTASTLSRTATSLTAQDAFSFEASFTMLDRVIKHTIPWTTLASDYALNSAGQGMADSIRDDLDKMFFDGLESLAALAHPRVGAGAGQVGAAIKYMDTGIKYLNGEAGEATQDNMITAALSESALNTALKLLQAYRSDRGAALHLGSNGGLTLVVANKNAQTAHELVRSQLSGADMASNYVQGLISDIVVYPFTTDDDDWFLVDPKKAPFGLAIGAAPVVTVTSSDDGLFAHIVGKHSACFWVSPYEAGFVGSDVA